MERLGYDLLNPKTRFAGSRYSITMIDSLPRVNVPTYIKELQGTPLNIYWVGLSEIGGRACPNIIKNQMKASFY